MDDKKGGQHRINAPKLGKLSLVLPAAECRHNGMVQKLKVFPFHSLSLLTYNGCTGRCGESKNNDKGRPTLVAECSPRGLL